MKILILNWRDIRNPASGGAEILTHEMAKRWAKKGHQVIQLSAAFKNAKSEEEIDGVHFIRKGDWWNVHFFAFFYYIINRNKIAVIIDEVHWFPFFSAWYARKKTIALTCEVATKLFFTLFPYPVALFFRGIEKIYLFFYKNIPTLVISESTKTSLINQGYNHHKLHILPMGLTIPKNLKKYPKEKQFTFIFLARLNKQKGIYDAIVAFSQIKKHIKNSNLWVVGSGENQIVKDLRTGVNKYGLTSSIKLFGHVNEKKKFELLARANLLLVPSVHEGWGLTVAEAATQGTPSIVYNVPGLRDVSKQSLSSIVLNKNTPSEMANKGIKIVKNKNLYEQLQKKGLESTKKMSWEKTATVALNIIQNNLYEKTKNTL